MLEKIRDIELHYETSGTREPLLLLHGFTGAGVDFHRMVPELQPHFRLIIPDLRGHGRSTNPQPTFLHREAALDILALLDRLGLDRVKAIGVSAGGNVLLHMATQQPQRIAAMVLASATTYFPEQCRAAMQQLFTSQLTPEERDAARKRHPRGDAQIEELYAQARAMAGIFDDMDFTPAILDKIKARTLLVQGDRDPLYPMEITVEMFNAIPRSSLWIVPGAGHGPVFLEHTPLFLKTALAFLQAE
jgi:pimeloyl-ACP methyl ester carboxylesterase